MKTINTFFAVVLSTGILAQSALDGAAAEVQWTSLFNGKDLTGWVGVNETEFKVVDGNLQLVKGMGWLRTEKSYRDFILELEWRALVKEYDSGIFIRAGVEGKPWPEGGWQVNLRSQGLGALVKGKKTMVPSETPRKPVNQWVKLRLEVRGKTCKLSMDGEDAWTTDVIDADRGYIGIQAENRAFDFRNIRVQELPPAAR